MRLILVADLAEAAPIDEVESLEIIETTTGYRVVANIKPRPAAHRYLTVRRRPDKPRMVFDVPREMKGLRKFFTDQITSRHVK